MLTSDLSHGLEQEDERRSGEGKKTQEELKKRSGGKSKKAKEKMK